MSGETSLLQGSISKELHKQFKIKCIEEGLENKEALTEAVKLWLDKKEEN